MRRVGSMVSDVAMSWLVLPKTWTGGVVHYKFGKAIKVKGFERTRHLSALPSFLLMALNRISMLQERKGHRIAQIMEQIVAKNARLCPSTIDPMPS